MNEQSQKITKKFITQFALAFITGAVAAAFALVRVANSDHFTLVAVGQRLDSIEETFVPRNDLDNVIKQLDLLRSESRDDFKSLNDKLDRLLIQTR